MNMYTHYQLDIRTCTAQIVHKLIEQCMSEYRAGYNNHCYYDPQVVHVHTLVLSLPLLQYQISADQTG